MSKPFVTKQPMHLFTDAGLAEHDASVRRSALLEAEQITREYGKLTAWGSDAEKVAAKIADAIRSLADATAGGAQETMK